MRTNTLYQKKVYTKPIMTERSKDEISTEIKQKFEELKALREQQKLD